MENYGELLKKAREERNLDFATIGRETSISQRYLEAMENEETHIFPSEPYLIGFLKNYADYLGLDQDKIVSLYHAKIIQETPPPAALTAHERPRFVVPLIVFLCILLISGGIVAIYFFMKSRPKAVDPEVALKKPTVTQKYELTETPFTGRLFKNDQLVLGTDKGNIILTVAQTNDVFGLETPVGIQYVELSEQVEMDADGDSMPEMIIYVKDLSTKANDRGAEVNIMLKSAANAAISSPDESLIQGASEIPKEQRKAEIISDTRAYPFTLNVSFRAGCLFRYRADRKDVVEDFLANGDVLNITASNGFRVWMSNGNTAKIQIVANGRSYDIPISKAGEVVAEDIKWIKDTDGKYKLVIIDLD